LQALYNFIGVVEVLQPSKECDFVLPDEGHDMLPPSAALYKLTEPQQQQQVQQAPAAAAPAAEVSTRAAGRSSPLRGSFNSLSSLTNISGLSSALAELTSSFSLGGSSSSRGSSSAGGGAAHPGDDTTGSSSSSLGMVAVPVADAPLAPLSPTGAVFAADVSPFADVQEEHSLSPAAALALSAAASKPPAPSRSSRGVVAKSPEGLTLGDAILTFMNSPHPLQTLGEMRAYGHNGSISRYHNPNSYTKALQKLSGV
jgi:hypothetical protein